jgi:hypothetical protein
MRWRPERLHPPLGALLVVGIGIGMTWLAASVALSDLRPDVLAAGLTSSLKADYGATEAETLSLSPLDDTIADSVAQDERDRAGERGGSEVVFAPIFLVGEGNQEPIRLPSGEVQPAPAPAPTQPNDATPTPTPAQPDQPTPEPQPTQPDQPTPEPQPTQPDHSTPTPKPTQPDHSTPTPKPTQPDHSTSTPKPTKTDQPTSTPKPTQPPKPTKKA